MQVNYEEQQFFVTNPDAAIEGKIKRSTSKNQLTDEPVRTISKMKHFEEDLKGTSPGRRKGTNTRLSDDTADNQGHMKNVASKDPPEQTECTLPASTKTVITVQAYPILVEVTQPHQAGKSRLFNSNRTTQTKGSFFY